MQILHVTQGYTPAIGGTEWLMQRISEELVQQFGDEVTVFTTNCYSGEAFFTPHLPRMATGWETLNGVRVRRFPVFSQASRFLRWWQAQAYRWGLPGNQYLRTYYSGPLVFGLQQAIARFPANVLAASSFPLLHMFTTLRAAQATHRPCVFIGGLHPQDEWGFGRPMIYQAIQRATHYIAYTQYEADYVIGKGADPAAVSVVGTGVDPALFEAPDTAEAKRRLGVGDEPLIGFIGQLGWAKGVDALIRALPRVWQVFPRARLLIAGARTLFADYLEKLAQETLGAKRDQLIFRYNFAEADKPWLFKAVDVFAYPSGYESFGIAFLEAWAAGKPVIGCRRGAIPWVVQAGRDGLLVGFQQSEALAEAINLLLSNPGWASALGAAGQQKVRAHYTWPIIAQRFRAAYQQAIAAQTPAMPSR